MNRLWYWTQLAIWPLIRDTDCMYCIFLRGLCLGFILGSVACLIHSWK
jgi:hypothetical protein